MVALDMGGDADLVDDFGDHQLQVVVGGALLRLGPGLGHFKAEQHIDAVVKLRQLKGSSI